MSIAVLVNREAVHIVHHQKRKTFFRAAPIKQLHDVGMVERGQCLALIQETAQQLRPIKVGAKQLDRHMHLKLLIVPGGQIDCCHAAIADTPLNAIIPDPAPEHGIFGFADRRR